MIKNAGLESAWLQMPAPSQTSCEILNKLFNLSEPPTQAHAPHHLGRTDSAGLHPLTRGCGTDVPWRGKGCPLVVNAARGDLRPRWVVFPRMGLHSSLCLVPHLASSDQQPMSIPKSQCGGNCLFYSTMRSPKFEEGVEIITSGVGCRAELA